MSVVVLKRELKRLSDSPASVRHENAIEAEVDAGVGGMSLDSEMGGVARAKALLENEIRQPSGQWL
ncbi:MAG TPA: hypothetical protein VNP95_01935, partial [Thermomicrobiales bacterium]|nr:hypothetical protein [Thermomicrobiales bacterium]